MERNYHALPSRALGEGAGFRRPAQPQPHVTLESPAREVMTDLTRVSPATIGPQESVIEANQLMMARGVRLLLVIDEQERVLGVISATDVLGERPMRVATDRGLRRDELTVGDIMTPAGSVEVIALGDLDGMHVGHVVSTLMHAGRQHALVIDEVPESGRRMVRGILSLSQVARQLGRPLQPPEVARTFAEIEGLLGH
jgi:CBS-domain-containing membrane protein